MGGSTRFPANGAESGVAVTPFALSPLRTELVTGGYDVVHLHEPVAPILCWDALTSGRGPLVGTFHVHGERRGSHGIAALGGARRRMNRLHVRIAVSEAAAETGRRFWGGRYRVIPNGVALPAAVAPAPGGVPLRVVFLGADVRRKGLDVLLGAWPAVAAAVPGAELRLVGTGRRVSDAQRDAELASPHVPCAPSPGGQSFRLVLAEAFDQGTP